MKAKHSRPIETDRINWTCTSANGFITIQQNANRNINENVHGRHIFQ